MAKSAPACGMFDCLRENRLSVVAALLVVLGPAAGYVLYVENRSATLEANARHLEKQLDDLRKDVPIILRALSGVQNGGSTQGMQALPRQVARLKDGSEALLQASLAEPRHTGEEESSILLLRPRPTDLRVRWGKGREFTDVTARALKLCDDRLPCNVIAGIEQLGPDPFVGLPKELVVEFRCNGERLISNQLIEREAPLLIACL